MDTAGHELMSSRGHEQMRGGSFARLVIRGYARALAPIRIAVVIGSIGTTRALPGDRTRITRQAMGRRAYAFSTAGPIGGTPALARPPFL